MRVYFDNAATTRVRQESIDKMVEVMGTEYGNPSSTHTMGRAARGYLDAARKSIATALGCSAEEVFFTSGGTESNNWVIQGAAELHRHRKGHIITSALEHESVLQPLKLLENRGFCVTYIAPQADGRIHAEDVVSALRPDTILVSCMMVNNETGAVNPIADIAAAVKGAGSSALLHTDAVQGLLKVPFSARRLGVDFISVSSHKIHGPKGSGALFIRSGVKLPALIQGGGQEGSLRSGTEALPAISGFGEAARLGAAEAEANRLHMAEIRDYIAAQLTALVPKATIISQGDAPHILSISLPGYRSEVLMSFLESREIYVSKSSACRRGAQSHVLRAMGLPARVIDGALRISFSRYSTMEEADALVRALKDAVENLFTVL